jgi:hypothetical protein
MPTPAELRAEARRCIEASRELTDLEAKRHFAARALELAQQAEALERAALNPPEENNGRQKPD